MAFSTPPTPSVSECKPLLERVGQASLTLVSAYYGLPNIYGKNLVESTTSAVVNIMTALKKLITVIREQGHEGCKHQLESTGGIWEHCDNFEKLPMDNKAAVLLKTNTVYGLVGDALSELEEAQNADGGLGLDDDEEEDTWSEDDRTLLGPTLGLLKASKGTIKKISTAIKANGSCTCAAEIQDLDELMTKISTISPAVDDLACSLYPPMAYGVIRQNSEGVAEVLKNVVSQLSLTHVKKESDDTWIEFLNKAIDHNLQKIISMTPSS